MTGNEIHTWLSSEIASALAAAMEGMTGERTPVECSLEAAIEPTGMQDPVCWRQPFTGISGAIWVVAEEDAWRAVGSAVLHAGGIEETDRDRTRAEYIEVVRQMLSGIGQAMSGRAAQEVTPAGGEQLNVIGEAAWATVEIKLGGAVARIAIGVESALLAGLAGPSPREVSAAPEKARTFDLLLDVELPVSVSFGRAQVPLKDVLKLTVGSIVELNRNVGDPVEVIVNNCVIARGEVVMVEGNFGVRIQNVITRQERLRTLD
jgi:flagellar motor switch protein FliN/FliY